MAEQLAGANANRFAHCNMLFKTLRTCSYIMRSLQSGLANSSCNTIARLGRSPACTRDAPIGLLKDHLYRQCGDVRANYQTYKNWTVLSSIDHSRSLLL
jgi:hypothetical protein